ncbi:MAG: formylglycine-generating enzyme family protein [Rhodomicrobium sp.]
MTVGDKMQVSALGILLLAAGSSWWQHVWIEEQYQRRWTMGAQVHAPIVEKQLPVHLESEFKECANGCPTMVVSPPEKFVTGPVTEADRSSNEAPQHDAATAQGQSGTEGQQHEVTAHPGSEFKECANGCPTMVVIPPGKFVMGSPETEEDRGGNEGPQHEVTIAKPFAVGKFTVTFDEWDACTASGACPNASDSGFGRNNRPVINVNWGDAKQYVAWLSRMTGKTYRLLSEAEWEYAARAGSPTAQRSYHSGSSKESGCASSCQLELDICPCTLPRLCVLCPGYASLP